MTEGGDDIWVEVGTLAFVGVDKGDQSEGEPVEGGNIHVCAASDFAGVSAGVLVDRGDLVPEVESGSTCLVDVSGEPCEVHSFRVLLGDGDNTVLLRVDRSGLPAGNGTTTVGERGEKTCLIAVGESC